MIPAASVGNVRRPLTNLGRFIGRPHRQTRPAGLRRVLAIAAVAVPAGGMTMCAPAARVDAAGPTGTLVAIQDGGSADDQIVAVRPDGGARHVVATGQPLTSVSMSDDGTIYVASDENYVSDDDTMYALAQNGAILDSWKVPNPGLGQLYGGISDSEIRRDGERLISQSIWSNCNGGGLSEICNVRAVTVPGSSTSLGNMTNENNAAWLGNTDYVVVDGGMSYYQVGGDTKNWFEDAELSRQWDGSVATTADGGLMAVEATSFAPEWADWWSSITVYAVDAAPPAAPTKLCTLSLTDLIGDPLKSGYVDGLSFSPAGDALAFAAGADFDDLAAYVINGFDAEACSYTSVTKVIDAGVTDLFWGHFGYDPNHGPVDPGNPGDPDPKPVPPGAMIVPVNPARFWDTRNESTFDGQAVNTGRLAGGTSYAVQIAGRGQVPAKADGVVANLTVVSPDAAGYATLYPCTATPPTASNLNYTPGAVAANNAVVPLDANGRVCVFTKAGADFVLDVNGFVPAGSGLVGVTPARYLDTRPGATTFDGAAAGSDTVAGGTHVEVQITGRGQVPAGAVAALVNVTAVTPDGPGFVTLYPCGQRPGTSTLNYGPGEVVPNGALVSLSANGTLCAFTKASSQLLIDVAGYVPGGATKLAPVVPARLADTRPGQATVDGQHTGTGQIPAGGTIEVKVAGRGNVPANATAAFFNVTVVNPSAAGFITLYPCGTRPTTSNVNHTPGVVRANNAMTQLSANGTVCIFSKAAADVVLDVTGWVG